MDYLSQAKHLARIFETAPKKGLSQNFLVDEKAYQKIIAAAELSPEDLVLEIGPGWGFLTAELVKAAKQVVAVEADLPLAEYLKKSTAVLVKDKLKIVNSDILKISNEKLFQEFTAAKKNNFSYKVVANLPYHITSPIIEKFLTQEPKPTKLVLLVQKEVAERICASPKSRQGEGMSILSVATQFYAKPEIIAIVPAASFWPVPKVDGAVLRLTVSQPARGQDNVDEKKFFWLVRVGFSARRKQLHNNLAAALRIPSAEVKKILASAGLNESVRPQELSVEDWLRLSDKVVRK